LGFCYFCDIYGSRNYSLSVELHNARRLQIGITIFAVHICQRGATSKRLSKLIAVVCLSVHAAGAAPAPTPCHAPASGKFALLLRYLCTSGDAVECLIWLILSSLKQTRSALHSAKNSQLPAPTSPVAFYLFVRALGRAKLGTRHSALARRPRCSHKVVFPYFFNFIFLSHAPKRKKTHSGSCQIRKVLRLSPYFRLFRCDGKRLKVGYCFDCSVVGGGWVLPSFGQQPNV